MASSYNELMATVHTLIEALRGNDLPQGVSAEAVEAMEAQWKKVEKCNIEQENYKVLTKMATKTLEDEKKKLHKIFMSLKKRIKMDVPQNLWGKYGFDDKQ